MPTGQPPAGAGPATAMSPPRLTSTPWGATAGRPPRPRGRRPAPWPWRRGRGACRPALTSVALAVQAARCASRAPPRHGRAGASSGSAREVAVVAGGDTAAPTVGSTRPSVAPRGLQRDRDGLQQHAARRDRARRRRRAARASSESSRKRLHARSIASSSCLTARRRGGKRRRVGDRRPRRSCRAPPRSRSPGSRASRDRHRRLGSEPAAGAGAGAVPTGPPRHRCGAAGDALSPGWVTEGAADAVCRGGVACAASPVKASARVTAATAARRLRVDRRLSAASRVLAECLWAGTTSASAAVVTAP